MNAQDESIEALETLGRWKFYGGLSLIVLGLGMWSLPLALVVSGGALVYDALS